MANHARIIQHPFTASLQGALLDSYDEISQAGHFDIRLTLRAIERTAPSEMFERDGIFHERVQGNYVPIELYFSDVSELKNSHFFANVTALAPNDPTRTINDMLSWRRSGSQHPFYLIAMHASQLDNLMFFARHVRYKRLSQPPIPFVREQDWCSPPPMPDRLVPNPVRIHQRFGGDPITLHMDGRPYHYRLFVGELEIQPAEHPDVDVVFNVGEEPSRWFTDDQIYPQDRWDNKGEGNDGMSLETIREEANWVIERLRKKQRVLVHCVAGMNRSTTICCAVLILLEGLTAEEALERVRQHHPWARPDSRHWLKLRWIANSQRAIEGTQYTKQPKRSLTVT